MEDYPVYIGNTLRLKRKDWQVRILSREGRQVERFVCVNTGKQPLRLSALLLPEYIHFHTEPEIISPGIEADMVLSIDKGLLPQRMNYIYLCWMVFLSGLAKGEYR